MTDNSTPSAVRLPGGHDGLVLDLDGVVYRGRRAVAGAVDALAALAAARVPVAYATNNAWRPPQEVAEQLTGLGIPTTADQVVTSAEIAVDLTAAAVDPGASVLVVGGPGLRQAVASRGFRLVSRTADSPAAVVQGFAPDTAWRDLAEASYAVQNGAIWVATNTDLTFPSEWGIAPGNGALVAAVSAATGRLPLVAGKPAPAMLLAAARRTGARQVLVVGDRLDSDIAGAHAAGLGSALVLTGVSTAEMSTAAPRGQRPGFVADDLLALVEGRWAVLDPEPPT